MHLPLIGDLIKNALSYGAFKSDVFAQVEPVGHVLEVPKVLGLSRKVLLPVPLIKQILAKGVAIRITLRVEPGPWVPIPIPSASHFSSGLKDQRADTDLARFV